ncbi:glycerol-3-phosphate 1-O-acyltransferase PlsY [Chloroflexota bacterium]
MDILIISLFMCGAFLCGSIPTGYLLVKHLKHLDVREVGSGNIGSTNVKRAAGRGISILAQAGDILKGLVPVAIVMVVIPHINLGVDRHFVTSLTAIAAIAGHDFTPFLRFRGGKGVNTSLGAFILIAPIPMAGTAVLFLLLRLVTPLVSIRSLVSSVSFPVLVGILHLSTVILVASSAAALLIVIRHTDNIKRLIAGTER